MSNPLRHQSLYQQQAIYKEWQMPESNELERIQGHNGVVCAESDV